MNKPLLVFLYNYNLKLEQFPHELDVQKIPKNTDKNVFDTIMKLKNRPKSITFIGPNFCFNYRFLFYASNNLKNIPWGVIPVTDHYPNIFEKFYNGKMNNYFFEKVLIDCINNKVMIKRNGIVCKSNLDSISPSDLISILTSNIGTLTIFAHGEGAHINLMQIVICGLRTENEKFLYNPKKSIKNGCSSKFCKRASQRGKYFLRATQINAHNIVLISCVGFSVAGDVFPSNINLIDSLLQSKCKCIITTSRIIEVPIDKIEAISNIFFSFKKIGHAIICLNSLWDKLYGFKPFILVGDPNQENISFKEYKDRFLIVSEDIRIKKEESKIVFSYMEEKVIPLLETFKLLLLLSMEKYFHTTIKKFQNFSNKLILEITKNPFNENRNFISKTRISILEKKIQKQLSHFFLKLCHKENILYFFEDQLEKVTIPAKEKCNFCKGDYELFILRSFTNTAYNISHKKCILCGSYSIASNLMLINEKVSVKSKNRIEVSFEIKEVYGNSIKSPLNNPICVINVWDKNKELFIYSSKKYYSKLKKLPKGKTILINIPKDSTSDIYNIYIGAFLGIKYFISSISAPILSED